MKGAIMKHFKAMIPYLIIIIAIAVVIGSSGALTPKQESPIVFAKAKVIRVISQELTEDPQVKNLYIGNQQLEVELLSEDFGGERHQVKNFLGKLYNVYAKEGMQLIMALEVQDGAVSNIAVYNYKRDNTIYIMAALFFIVLAAVGGKKGIKSILSLVFTGVLVLFVLIPLIYKGYNPIATAVVVAALTTSISLYLISGWSKKTLAAIAGTVSGVVIAGIISYTAGTLSNLSGLTMEQAEELLQIASQTNMNVRGLMFASILIAALGAIMDTAISIASAVFEMHSISPEISKGSLIKSAMNVGRDVIGTMSNTLILAFAGGALNTMLIIMAYKMPYIQIVNLDLVSTEVIQSIAGSIGIVLTVPITALISVLLINYKTVKTN